MTASPCQRCVFGHYIKTFDETEYEPAEYDSFCDNDMNSFDTDEGCYEFEEDYAK